MPAVGRISPSSILSVVVLPAPFGSEEAVDLAAPYGEVHVVDGESVAVALGQMLGVHDGLGHVIIVRRWRPGPHPPPDGTDVRKLAYTDHVVTLTRRREVSALSSIG